MAEVLPIPDGEVVQTMSSWPTDSRKRIEIVYSANMMMPEDFYEFFEFCCSLNRADPLNAIAPTCGLKLVGPFEFLGRNVALSDSGKNYYRAWNFSRTIEISRKIPIIYY